MEAPRLCGLVLAAGAGTRFGGPKALARSADGTPWVHAAVRMLRAAGCAEVLVALGAGGDEAAALVPPDATIVRVADWADGLSATLRTGLAAAESSAADAVVITPVDTPAAPAAAAVRVISLAGARAGLAQAMYDGEPGHPVFIGRDHFAAAAASLSGDRGAGPYLRAHGALAVECGDLWSGADIDHDPGLNRR
ncbi:NTP transferase domain-containing protein [uncultured Microbacterium sp.]|uniref:nucleotidyltransferase family protein n=1 Tax=uncultured Microbacterium sp. TaxID=191216 RepID=UPI0035CBBDF5